jgi:hypothetical protein
MVTSVPAQRAPRVTCPCGGRNTVRVVLEYIPEGGGSVEYLGGRFCYNLDALIDLEVPPGAVPLQLLLYSFHEPDEQIRITFVQSRHRRRTSPGGAVLTPGEAGDQQGM